MAAFAQSLGNFIGNVYKKLRPARYDFDDSDDPYNAPRSDGRDSIMQNTGFLTADDDDDDDDHTTAAESALPLLPLAATEWWKVFVNRRVPYLHLEEAISEVRRRKVELLEQWRDDDMHLVINNDELNNDQFILVPPVGRFLALGYSIAAQAELHELLHSSDGRTIIKINVNKYLEQVVFGRHSPRSTEVRIICCDKMIPAVSLLQVKSSQVPSLHTNTK